MKPEAIEALVQQDGEPDELDIDPENWDAVRVFQRSATQWRWIIGAKALRIGLDYSGVMVVLRSCRIPAARRDQVFSDVQVMESAALEVFSAKGAK